MIVNVIDDIHKCVNKSRVDYIFSFIDIFEYVKDFPNLHTLELNFNLITLPILPKNIRYLKYKEKENHTKIIDLQKIEKQLNTL